MCQMRLEEIKPIVLLRSNVGALLVSLSLMGCAASADDETTDGGYAPGSGGTGSASPGIGGMFGSGGSFGTGEGQQSGGSHESR